MEKEAFEEYLKNRYNKEIDWYNRKSVLNHWIHQTLQLTMIVLTAIMPVLIFLGEGLLYWTLFVSILITIGTSALKVFKFYENWINFRTTCETLRKELHYYKAKINGYEDVDDPEAVFVNRVEAIISREHSLWLMAQKRKATLKKSA